MNISDVEPPTSSAPEPKAGRHFTLPTPNRSAPEFAKAIKTMVNSYPEATTIHLVMDNLNIHRCKALRDHFGDEKRRSNLGSIDGPLHTEARQLAESGRD